MSVNAPSLFRSELFKVAVVVAALLVIEEWYTATIKMTPVALYPAMVAFLAFVAVNFGAIAWCRNRLLLLSSLSLYWVMFAARDILVIGADPPSEFRAIAIAWAVNLACVTFFHVAFHWKDIRSQERVGTGNQSEEENEEPRLDGDMRH
jgi:hypothetical protein